MKNMSLSRLYFVQKVITMKMITEKVGKTVDMINTFHEILKLLLNLNFCFRFSFQFSLVIYNSKVLHNKTIVTDLVKMRSK